MVSSLHWLRRGLCSAHSNCVLLCVSRSGAARQRECMYTYLHASLCVHSSCCMCVHCALIWSLHIAHAACMIMYVCMCVSACSAQEQLDLVCTSGRPFCLLDVRLMGPEGTPLQPGSTQVGEVQCRGPTVFKGYWQLPQASMEAFSDGWFCTGDLATINTAGYITVVDRIKDMILHGQRPSQAFACLLALTRCMPRTSLDS